jgi:hypothetical protein
MDKDQITGSAKDFAGKVEGAAGDVAGDIRTEAAGMPYDSADQRGCEAAKCGSVKGAQNWNGATETDILPSDDCWTVKLTSFEAFVSPTITEIEPLHFSVRLSPLVDVMTIFWREDITAAVLIFQLPSSRHSISP